MSFPDDFSTFKRKKFNLVFGSSIVSCTILFTDKTQTLIWKIFTSICLFSRVFVLSIPSTTCKKWNTELLKKF